MSEKIKKIKEEKVAQIAEKAKKAQSIVFVDYRGISVTNDTVLRAALRKENVEYRVLKNRMVHRALTQLGYEGLDAILEGPSAFAFSFDDPVSGGRILSEKSAETKISIKGGIVEGKLLDADQMKAVAKIPPKPVLIAQFLGLLQSPIRNLAVVLSEAAKKQG